MIDTQTHNIQIREEWGNWENQNPNSFIYQVSKPDANEGLHIGLERLNRRLYGTQKGRIYLVGADSGVGKTTVADFMFVLNAYTTAKKVGKKLKIFYYSLEISKVDKIARWVSYYIYHLTGRTIPSDYILRRVPGKDLTKDDLELVKQAYTFVAEMFDTCIVFSEELVHPTKIFEDLVETHYKANGEIIRGTVSDADKRKGKKGKVIGYVPKDPNMMTLLFIDHLALLSSEMGLSLKGTMDKMSRYCVILRNLFGCTPILIQQFSTDLLQSRREIILTKGSNGAAELVPNRLDFGDSKTVYRDADVVLGLIKPYEFGLSSFNGWTLAGGLMGYLIALYVMKNRYGPTGIRSTLFINPIAGVLFDIHKGKELNSVEAESELGFTPKELEWYKKAIQIDEENGAYSSPGETETD